MTSRKPPTVQEIADLLREKLTSLHWETLETMELDPLHEGRAMEWEAALTKVKTGMRTNWASANKWLVDAVTAEASPLAALRLYPSACLIARGPDGKEVRAELGWPREVGDNLRFDTRGFLLDIDNKGSLSAKARWVVLREALPVMRERIQTQLAVRADQRAIEQRERDAEFDRIHGADLAAVNQLLDQVQPLEDDEPSRSGILTTSVMPDPRGTVAELFGTNGTLTINLFGRQITEFADAIRALENNTSPQDPGDPL